MKRFIFMFMLISMIFVTQGAMAANTHHHAVSKKINTARVDINHASATELATLKGLGPKKAATIVAYRQAHGDFHSVDDLSKVHGIGTKALARLMAKNSGRIVINN